MPYRIIHKQGYCEVQDLDGRFICTGDNEIEALDEVEKMFKEWELD